MTKAGVIDRLCREAMWCDHCFEGGKLARTGSVTVPQPRPVPDGYWTSSPKTVLVLPNPNSGAAAPDVAGNDVFDVLLHAYRDGGPYCPVAKHIYQGLKEGNWFRGTFKELYIKGLGLNLDTLALANIAWCATRKEDEKHLWEACFERHTGPLLHELNPDVVLLGGDDAYRRRGEAWAQCPNTLIAKVLHCSALNRPPHDRTARIGREAEKFRQIIQAWHRGERGLYN
jgi:hypothetical protein